ncbi:hypothetical protein LIT32_12365 [Bacillus sp. CMF21]|nr:hypothetical protein LIT32_12365 [Bacillus sp. CMF21]
MSKLLLALSFLKEKKVDYYFDRNTNKIVFPCFHCGANSKMDACSTLWKCSICLNDGNLSNLINIKVNSDAFQTIYNPHTSLKKINNTIKFLIKNYPNNQMRLLEMELALKKLVEYYQKELEEE